MKRTLKESIYDFKPIRSVSADQEFAFTSEPTRPEFNRISDMIAQAIVTVATGGQVYIKTPDRRTGKFFPEGPYVIKRSMDTSRSAYFVEDRCILEVLCEGPATVKVPTRILALSDILECKTHVLAARVDGKLTRDTDRITKIQELLGIQAARYAELLEAERPERERREREEERRRYRARKAQATRDGRIEERNRLDQEEFEQLVNDATGLSIAGMEAAIFWIARHIGTITIKFPENLLETFKRSFPECTGKFDETPLDYGKDKDTSFDPSKEPKKRPGANDYRITVISDDSYTSGGNRMQQGFSATLSLTKVDDKDVPEAIKDMAKRGKGSGTMAISDVVFILSLMRNYGFKPLNYTSNKTAKRELEDSVRKALGIALDVEPEEDDKVIPFRKPEVVEPVSDVEAEVAVTVDEPDYDEVAEKNPFTLDFNGPTEIID